MGAEADMSGAYFVVGLGALVILSLVSLVGLQVVLPWWLRRRHRRRAAPVSVSRSRPAPAPHSVKWEAPTAPVSSDFPASRREAEAEVRAGSADGSELANAHGLITFTEKALQSRDAEQYERGMLDAYATLLRLGYLATPLADKRKGEMQEALAATAGNRATLLPGLSGRALGRLAAALDDVPVATPPEAEAYVTPLAERATPAKFRKEPEPA